MTKSILNFYGNIEQVVNGLVSLVVNIFMFAITTLAPLAAPIAPAFSVYKALSERLETPFAIALAGAIAIEITGMFVAKTSIGCHNWNSIRNKTEPEAPKSLAITMASIFFSVIFILSLTIELNPALAVYVYPGFVIVAICVYVCLAISNNLAKWENDKAAELEARQIKNGLASDIRNLQSTLEKLKEQKAANSENSSFVPGDLENLKHARATKKSNIQARRNEVADLYNSGKKTSEIAKIMSCSADTIRRDIKSLNGKLEAAR